jgi:hypothetical protein
MNDVKIFGKSLSNEEVAALKALAIEAGCDPMEIDVVDSISGSDTDSDDEILLILATPATCSETDLEKEMAKAASGVCRTIWVWPKEAPIADVPEATKKYSYSMVPWDAQKLAAVIADDDVTCFELPTGQPMPKEKMEHNLCVEDPKKPKKTK